LLSLNSKYSLTSSTPRKFQGGRVTKSLQLSSDLSFINPSPIYHQSIINLSIIYLSHPSINLSIYLYIYLSSIHHLTLSIICLSSIYHLSIYQLYLSTYLSTTYLSSIYNLMSSINHLYIIYQSSIYHLFIIILSFIYSYFKSKYKHQSDCSTIIIKSSIVYNQSPISYHVINVQFINTFGVISTRSNE